MWSQRMILILGCYLNHTIETLPGHFIIKLTGISKPGFGKKFYSNFIEPGPRRQLSSGSGHQLRTRLREEHLLCDKHRAGCRTGIFFQTITPPFCKMKTKTKKHFPLGCDLLQRGRRRGTTKIIKNSLPQSHHEPCHPWQRSSF